MQKTIAILVVLILPTLATQAKADIIFDNLKSTTYTPKQGEAVAGTTFGGQSSSTSFVAGVTANLEDILVPMWFLSPEGSPAFDLSLSDSSNTVLESWTDLTAPALIIPPFPPPAVSVVDVASVVDPLLIIGDTYTLTASANNASTDDGWEDVTDTLTANTVGFRVLGEATTTPEPASLTLFGTALFALGGFSALRRRRRGALESDAQLTV